MRKVLTALLLLSALYTSAQSIQKIQLNKGYDSIPVIKGINPVLEMKLEKGIPYKMMVLQQGIDVELILTDKKNDTLATKDSPNGRFGFEILDYTPTQTQTYHLTIRKFEQASNSDSGKVSYYIKQYNTLEKALLEKTKAALAIENEKPLLTMDIDHFWEACDGLKDCHTTWDSLLCFQVLYLDRATDGLKDFIRVRDFTAEKFVYAMRKMPKYYASVRNYTFEAKKAEPLVNEVFEKFKSIYGNFKPFHVCFAIGFHNTGGTVSERFVLLGTEMVLSGPKTDWSELIPNWKPKANPQEPDFNQAIKGIVMHECVHTQQQDATAPGAVVCPQLFSCLHEGAANFIGEMLTGSSNYSEVNDYGEKHEKALWEEFKSTLCYPTVEKWLYNGETSKNRPPDLGYYIGYKIVQAYYNHAQDKKQAIIDIIDMNDPLGFLQKSGYDQQPKK